MHKRVFNSQLKSILRFRCLTFNGEMIAKRFYEALFDTEVMLLTYITHKKGLFMLAYWKRVVVTA